MKNVLKWSNFTVLTLMIILLPVMGCLNPVTNPALQEVLIGNEADLAPGTAVTDLADMVEGQEYLAIRWPVEDLPDLAQSAALKIFGENTEYVLSTKEAYLRMPQPGTPIKKIKMYTEATAEGKTDWLSTGMGLVGTFGDLLPGGPLVKGLLLYGGSLVASRRSRQHLGKAASSVLPTNGSVELGAALSSLLKATGHKHTNETPEELRAVANKLEASKKANETLNNSRVA